MKTAIALLVGVVLVSNTGLPFTQEYPHAFPRPGAEELVENECVFVWEVVWPNGTPERHAIMIDLKEHAPTKLKARTDIPLAFPLLGGEQLIDNPRVRAWDVAMRTGQTIPMHFHDRDLVWVFLEGGTVLSTGEDGQEERTTWAYKDVRFLPRGQAHTVEVLDGSPRVILYELE
jgi:quercetin dioxygenase-like cupin family protein